MAYPALIGYYVVQVLQYIIVGGTVVLSVWLITRMIYVVNIRDASDELAKRLTEWEKHR